MGDILEIFCYEIKGNVLYFQNVHHDLDSIHDEYLRIREKILKQLEGISPDSEQARFLHSELDIINEKLLGLQGLYSAYHHRSFIFIQGNCLFGSLHFVMKLGAQKRVFNEVNLFP